MNNSAPIFFYTKKKQHHSTAFLCSVFWLGASACGAPGPIWHSALSVALAAIGDVLSTPEDAAPAIQAVAAELSADVAQQRVAQRTASVRDRCTAVVVMARPWLRAGRREGCGGEVV